MTRSDQAIYLTQAISPIASIRTDGDLAEQMMGRFDAEEDSVFSIAARRMESVVRAGFGDRLYNILYYSVFTISPDVPRRVWLNFHEPDLGRTILSSASVAALFTLGFTIFITALSGTLLRDADPRSIQLLEDPVNLTLYLIVCPAYVALSCAMLGLATEFWSRPIVSTDDHRLMRPTTTRLRGIASLALVLFGASLSISQYQYDLLTNPALEVRYWFLASLNGMRVLNRAGFYYVILNFGLLCIALSGALAYCSLALQAVRDSRTLAGTPCTDPHVTLERFRDFKAAVVLARLLVICYMANTILWSYSPLGKATLLNILVTTVLIVCAGVLGTKLPDRYVLARINDWRDRCLNTGTSSELLSLVPNIPRWLLILSQSLGYFIGFGFLTIMFPLLDSGDYIRDGLEWFAR